MLEANRFSISERYIKQLNAHVRQYFFKQRQQRKTKSTKNIFKQLSQLSNNLNNKKFVVLVVNLLFFIMVSLFDSFSLLIAFLLLFG